MPLASRTSNLGLDPPLTSWMNTKGSRGWWSFPPGPFNKSRELISEGGCQRAAPDARPFRSGECLPAASRGPKVKKRREIAQFAKRNMWASHPSNRLRENPPSIEHDPYQRPFLRTEISGSSRVSTRALSQHLATPTIFGHEATGCFSVCSCERQIASLTEARLKARTFTAGTTMGVPSELLSPAHT